MFSVAKITQPATIFDGPYYLSIAGKLLASRDSFDVVNPATGKVFAKAPSGTAEQLDEAIAGAKTAFKLWSELKYAERQQYLNAYADELEKHRDELARLLTNTTVLRNKALFTCLQVCCEESDGNLCEAVRGVRVSDGPVAWTC